MNSFPHCNHLYLLTYWDFPGLFSLSILTNVFRIAVSIGSCSMAKERIICFILLLVIIDHWQQVKISGSKIKPLIHCYYFYLKEIRIKQYFDHLTV